MLHQEDIWGKTNLENSLEFIRANEPPEGYLVCFSGGKDSIVLKDLVIRAKVKAVFVYSFTGIDPPELVRYIRQHHPDVLWVRNPKTFWQLIYENGYPTIWRRWCCRLLKEFVPVEFEGLVKLSGIRAEESYKRARRGQISTHKKVTTKKPIFFWKEGEVWDYIETQKLPYCRLYDDGFSRIGCVVCPYLTGPKLKRNIDRWPAFYKAFEIAIRARHTNPKKRSSSYTVESDLEWWYGR